MAPVYPANLAPCPHFLHSGHKSVPPNASSWNRRSNTRSQGADPKKVRQPTWTAPMPFHDPAGRANLPSTSVLGFGCTNSIRSPEVTYEEKTCVCGRAADRLRHRAFVRARIFEGRPGI